MTSDLNGYEKIMCLPRRTGIFLILGALLFTGISFFWLRGEAGEDAREKAKEKGLTFDVPDDWPIEERNGAIGPAKSST